MFPGPRWWQGARSPSPFCQGHAKPWYYEMLLERRGLRLNSCEECGIPHPSQPVTMAVNLLQALGRPALKGLRDPMAVSGNFFRSPCFSAGTVST